MPVIRFQQRGSEGAPSNVAPGTRTGEGLERGGTAVESGGLALLNTASFVARQERAVERAFQQGLAQQASSRAHADAQIMLHDLEAELRAQGRLQDFRRTATARLDKFIHTRRDKFSKLEHANVGFYDAASDAWAATLRAEIPTKDAKFATDIARQNLKDVSNNISEIYTFAEANEAVYGLQLLDQHMFFMEREGTLQGQDRNKIISDTAQQFLFARRALYEREDPLSADVRAEQDAKAFSPMLDSLAKQAVQEALLKSKGDATKAQVNIVKSRMILEGATGPLEGYMRAAAQVGGDGAEIATLYDTIRDHRFTASERELKTQEDLKKRRSANLVQSTVSRWMSQMVGSDRGQRSINEAVALVNMDTDLASIAPELTKEDQSSILSMMKSIRSSREDVIEDPSVYASFLSRIDERPNSVALAGQITGSPYLKTSTKKTLMDRMQERARHVEDEQKKTVHEALLKGREDGFSRLLAGAEDPQSGEFHRAKAEFSTLLMDAFYRGDDPTAPQAVRDAAAVLKTLGPTQGALFLAEEATAKMREHILQRGKQFAKEHSIFSLAGLLARLKAGTLDDKTVQGHSQIGAMKAYLRTLGNVEASEERIKESVEYYTDSVTGAVERTEPSQPSSRRKKRR